MIEGAVGTWSTGRVVAPIREKMRAEPLTRRGGEKTSGDDLISVDIIEIENHRASDERRKRFHAQTSVRASTMRPVTAAAAAVSGLARKVLPPAP